MKLPIQSSARPTGRRSRRMPRPSSISHSGGRGGAGAARRSNWIEVSAFSARCASASLWAAAAASWVLPPMSLLHPRTTALVSNA